VANQEHLDILRQGVEAWNQWKHECSNIDPDLSGADLSRANLNNADLGGADLGGANLRRANLNNADLGGAHLDGANLSRVHLSNANLFKADFQGADLSNARLSGADFSRANLFKADLGGAHLDGANLSNAIVGWTIFGNIDLHTVKGLEMIKHIGPSTIGIDTILRSEGKIPESFLRGAGVPDTFITYMCSLINNPIEYYTCFISYSSKNQTFAERLYADLQNNNVRCWYAPEDLKIGDKFRVRIDESIRLYDKLLLILSEHSVRSPWVETEVETAFSKEHKTGKLALFPVKLDNTVEETEEAWAATIHRTRHIGDFTRWKEHDEYQKALTRLLRDLKQDTIHDTIESDADKD
jgi:hypothetical protein